MRKTLLVVFDSENPDKLIASRNAIRKYLENYDVAIKERIIPYGGNDKPVTEAAVKASAYARMKTLRSEMQFEHQKTAFDYAAYVVLQKGQSIEATTGELLCVALLYFFKDPPYLETGDRVPLARSVINDIQAGKDPYESLRLHYGNKIADKKASLYELLTKRTEVDWYEKPLSCCLEKSPLRHYFDLKKVTIS